MPGNQASTTSDVDDFDLGPPSKRRSKPPSIETLSELLFSSGHLDSLLQHPPQLARFSAFLQRYTPQQYPLLTQYLETRKAIKAVEYANAIAEGLKPKELGGTSTETSTQAATLDPKFESVCKTSFDALGRQETLTDAGGRVTVYSFDMRGNVKSISSHMEDMLESTWHISHTTYNTE